MGAVIKILAIGLSLFALSVRAEGYGIPVSDNWAHVAKLSRDTQVPIIVIFTAADCAYCDKLKQEVILPMLDRGDFRGKALVREFSIDRGGKITDFDSERTRSRLFVARYDVFATPTVVILDEQGNELLSPLVGYDEIDSYLDRLEQTLADALSALTTLKKPDLAMERRIAE